MKSDMNPHAITARLKKTSELRRLCITLGGNRLKARLLRDNQIPVKILNNQYKHIDRSMPERHL